MRTHVDLISQAMSHRKHTGHPAAHTSHVDSHPDTRRISSCVIMEKCRPREEHNFHLVAEPSVADCGMRHESGSVESLVRVCERTQRCMPASAWKEAARIVELEREKEQLEDDLLTFLGKIDQMQKKIDVMTLNENHDAEFVAKVMKERGRVAEKKKQHSEEAREAFERAKGASKEAMRRKNAELEAVRRQMKQAQAENKSLKVDRDVLLKEQVRLEQVCRTKSTLVELQKQIADLTVENTRLKVCA